MATNESLRDADHVSLPVPAGTKSGSPVRVGILNAVTVTDRANTSVSPTNADGTLNASYNAGGGNADGNASCWLKGAHTFQGIAFATTVGQQIYITSANALSDSASGNQPYGAALTAKSATAGPLTVRLSN